MNRMNRSRSLRQNVVHRGVDLLAVDGVLGHGVADAEARGPQGAPDVLVQLAETQLGQANCLQQGL